MYVESDGLLSEEGEWKGQMMISLLIQVSGFCYEIWVKYLLLALFLQEEKLLYATVYESVEFLYQSMRDYRRTVPIGKLGEHGD